jgi:hypothetical protein
MESQEFFFSPDTLEIRALGQSFDGRALLRNLEGELRESTGYPQIVARFIKGAMAADAVTVEHDERIGFVVMYYPFNIMNPERDDECREYLRKWIVNHGKAKGIKPAYPPLPGRVVQLDKDVRLDTKSHQYLSIASDGGEFIAFYQERSSERFFMMRNLTGVGAVCVELTGWSALTQAENAVKADCTDFCRLSGGENDVMRQIEAFVRKHNI